MNSTLCLSNNNSHIYIAPYAELRRRCTKEVKDLNGM